MSLASSELDPVIQKFQDAVQAIMDTGKSDIQALIADFNTQLAAREADTQTRIQQILDTARQEFSQAAKDLGATVASYEFYAGIRQKAV